MKNHNIILDCDPGHDDAIAIVLASQASNINLLGITVSAGNQTLEKTGRNALNLVQYLNQDIPVCLGVSEPLIRPQQIADDIHGESGLDGFEFDPLTIEFDTRTAIEFIIETLETSQTPVSIVTTGPMTNLALAFKVKPSIKNRIEKIIFMGGSFGYGNVSPAAEFNVLVDPEAADIVIRSGVDITMVGLDVTRKVLVEDNIINRMNPLNTKTSRLFVKLMKAFNENQRRVFNLPGGPLHDPVTIASLIDDTLLTTQKVHLEIDLSKGPSYGRTNCDMFNYLKQPQNVFVATDIDVDKFWDIIETSLKKYV